MVTDLIILFSAVSLAALVGYIVGQGIGKSTNNIAWDTLTHNIKSLTDVKLALLDTIQGLKDIKPVILQIPHVKKKPEPNPKPKIPEPGISKENAEEFDKKLKEIMYTIYPKEMLEEFENLSDIEKQQVVNELKSRRNGDSQSISSEAG